MYILILLCIIATSTLYLILNKRYQYWQRKGVPYPKPVPFFGNTGKVVTLQTTLDKVLGELYVKYKDFKYVGFFNLWHPAIIIRDTELIKDILIKKFGSFSENWIEVELNIDSAIGYNPFVLKPDKWKTIRAQLTPQFTSLKIKQMFAGIQNGCNNLTNYIEKQIDSTGSNVLEAIDFSARFTGDNVISCAYGLDGRSFAVKVPDSFKVGDQISSTGKLLQIKQTIALFSPWLRKLCKLTFLGDPVPKLFRDLIIEAMRYREENNILRNDFLDFMRDLKKKFPSEVTDELLIAHAFTFFLDGFETSSLALSYALMELGLNPDVQNTAQTEVDAILKKHNNELTYECIQDMQYIDNILTETLRKHPIIKVISRVCIEDCEFPSPEQSFDDGKTITIEKGTQIFLPVVAIHNDTTYYPDPENFNPDRHNDESKTTQPKGCFLGFGDGPRICLGRRFAIAQIKSALVSILSKFDVKFNTKTKLPIQMEMLHVFNTPKGGIWLEFYKRK